MERSKLKPLERDPSGRGDVSAAAATLQRISRTSEPQLLRGISAHDNATETDRPQPVNPASSPTEASGP
jgi:hypothetical protein